MSVTLYGKRDFADAIRLGILRSRWTLNVIPSIFIKARQTRFDYRRGNRKQWQKQDVGMQGIGHNPTSARSFHKLEEARKDFFPTASRRNLALPIPWLYLSETDFRLLLQKCKKINVCCLFIFERERENQQGRGRERGRHRIWRRLQALSCQHSLTWGSNPQLWDHDLSRSQSPNQLSHPGAPENFVLKILKDNKTAAHKSCLWKRVSRLYI